MTHFEYEIAHRYFQFAEEANLMDFLNNQSNQQLLKKGLLTVCNSVLWNSAIVRLLFHPVDIIFTNNKWPILA